MHYGRINPDDQNETFCMTVLALRMSRDANGVSELHSNTSREMWKGLYPGTPVAKINIGHITNGVNTTGWTAPTALEFWTERLGSKWTENLADRKFWATLLTKRISDEDLWALRCTLRRELVEFTRKRLREQDLMHGGGGLGLYDDVLSPDVLTIGFARRFATYKRAPLFFRDIEWAIRTINNKERPVQLIFAGKAHPRDDAGKHFIQEIINISKRVDLFGKVVFIQNYDINVARHMVAGSDIWLNTPRRPMEASGTSGMKSIIHGGLHCSTMDGWWREAYDEKNGWKIGEDITAENEHTQDDLDAASLRALMETKIVPLFYDRGKHGIPHKWLKMVRHAMATLIPVYNTDRMVAEYTMKYYLR
jgi:starch phosphorylase